MLHKHVLRDLLKKKKKIAEEKVKKYEHVLIYAHYNA